jgi:chromosomal replication initiation ATPase DnaA
MFDNFVVGPGNRLATAAAWRVAGAPGESYNPFFIYSSSGLGKSHILNGIVHYAARVHPDFCVVYVTVESFLNELTQAVQTGSEQGLRQRYEELHILLLDDVQFFTGQNEAQEMLLRLLGGMSKSGGQVVLASDRPPAEINGLDERLLTRFSGGLIVDIAAPEYERAISGGQAFKALGDQALGHGDKAQAKPYYEAALKWAPRLREDVLIKLGAIELENSNTEEAAVLWRRALELNPNNTSLRTKIDQLGAVAAT